MTQHKVKRQINTKPRKDLTGIKFNLLTPIYWIKGVGWHCKCDCGRETNVSTAWLKSGHTKSCGCLNKYTKNLIDMTNYENDDIKVIGLAPKVVGMEPRWICICKHCNKKLFIKSSKIRNVKKLCSCRFEYSKNETKIRQLFNDANINYAEQVTFNDLLGTSGGHLRFDFALLDENNNIKRLIEFNGKQHYEKPSGTWANTYDNTIKNDKRKIDYCKRHNIDLKIIKYDEEYTLDDLIN